MTDSKRTRRNWTLSEKQQIVLETRAAGASVSEVARRHGINANLLFNWRRSLQVVPEPPREEPVGQEVDFVPLEVFSHGEDGGAALATQVAASPPVPDGSEDVAPRYRLPPPPKMDERPGVIEIDLPDGVRVRVDPFVNAQALQRVFKSLKVLP